jgi:putative transposase
LDHLLILSERHLDYVLREYSQYYNRARPHQGLRQQMPESLNRQPGQGAVQQRNILGGLIHDYYRAAA